MLSSIFSRPNTTVTSTTDTKKSEPSINENEKIAIFEFFKMHSSASEFKVAEKNPLHLVTSDRERSLLANLIETSIYEDTDVYTQLKEAINLWWALSKECRQIILERVQPFINKEFRFALSNLNFKFAEKLILNGASVEQQNAFSPIALLISYLAITIGHTISNNTIKMLEFLLNNGANVNAAIDISCYVFYGQVSDLNATALMLLILKTDGTAPEQHLKSFKHNDIQKLADLLIKYGANVNVQTEIKKMTALHYAAELGLTDWVVYLLEHGANVNAKNVDGKTPIELALRNQRNKHKIEVIRKLIEHGGQLPSYPEGLQFLTLKLPPVSKIEYYDEKNEAFTSNEESFINTVKLSKKDIAVLFFSEYDHEPNSPYYGAVTQYYSNNYEITYFYKKVSENYTTFRVLVNSVEQMECAMKTIKSFLSKGQKIQHMMVHSHGDESRLALGQRGRYSFLERSDCNLKNRLLAKMVSYLDENATIALFSCNSATDKNSISEVLSVLAKNRVIFGAAGLVDFMGYKNIYHRGKQLSIPFFKDGPVVHVSAFKDGKQIGMLTDMPRSRL